MAWRRAGRVSDGDAVSDWLLAHEPMVRLSGFLGVFALAALWEALVPRRPRALSRALRWTNNLALVALNTVAVRLAVPVAAVGAALFAEANGLGLFNVLDAPGWLAFAATLLVLDLAIYLQHVVFHAVPPLWRLHRMHHADLEFDVTTGLRFHPLEIVVSMLWKLVVVIALGAPAAAVVAFEVLLNASSMFNHANARLPLGVDRALRLALVTPDMHRVHHSVRREETDSNYGFCLTWWDRLFRTYRAQPRDGHAGMTIGLERFRAAGELRLDRMLLQPLRGDARER